MVVHLCANALPPLAQVSNMLVPAEASQTEVKIDKAVLLVLYEAIHLNRNFITVLTHVRYGVQGRGKGVRIRMCECEGCDEGEMRA